MSFLKKLFKSKSKQPYVKQCEAFEKIKSIEVALLKRQEFLEKKVNDEMEIITKNATTNKRISLQALKRKKRLEKQLEQIDGTLTNLEFQQETLTNSKSNIEILKILKQTGKSLKGVHLDIGIDQVGDMIEQVRGQQQIAHELSQAISDPFCIESDLTNLSQELDKLEIEHFNAWLKDSNNNNIEELPDVPSTEFDDLPKDTKDNNNNTEEQLTWRF